MAGSPIRPARFGFFASGPQDDVFGPSVSTAALVSVAEAISSKELARISQREGEDALLTGGTRSLSRRLLALNIAGTSRPPLAAQPVRQALSA